MSIKTVFLWKLQYFFERGIKVITLDTPLVSTGDNKLDYTINDMLINFLSYIADKERERIQGRVIEGLKNAKDRGIKLGRPFKLISRYLYKVCVHFIIKSHKARKIQVIHNILKLVTNNERFIANILPTLY